MTNLLTLEQLRTAQRHCFQTKFEEITSSKLYRELQNVMDLNDYSLQVISETYKNQLIDAACYGYSILGSNPVATAFQCNARDYMMERIPQIEHLLKTGLCIIAIDKNNLVSASKALLDLCDDNYNKTTERYPSKLKHKKEFVKAPSIMFEQQNKEYRIIKNINLKKRKSDTNIINKYYGKWCERTLYFCRPDLRSKGITLFITAVMDSISSDIGYKYAVSRAANPRSHNRESARKCSQNIADMRFEDGTTMDDYFDDLRQKWNYSEQAIAKMRQLCIGLFVYEMGDGLDWRQRMKEKVKQCKIYRDKKSRSKL